MPRPKKIVPTAETEKEVKAPEQETAPVETQAPKAVKSKMVCVADYPADDDDDDSQRILEALHARGQAEGFKLATNIDRPYLPFPKDWIAMQWLIGRPGIPLNTVIAVAGEEGLGKSSLVVSMFGEFIKRRMKCLYISTEPKGQDTTWMARLMSDNIEEGHKLLNKLVINDGVYTLKQMETAMKEYVDVVRNELQVPKAVPIVVAVDSYTKLMNPEEADALMAVDKRSGKDLSLKSNLDDVSKKPGVTAKWLALWSRSLKHFLENNNVTMVLVAGSTQDQKANSMLPEAYIAKHNKSKPGGVAINQIASIIMKMSQVGIAKDSSNNQIGYKMSLFTQKNTYGKKEKDLTYIYKDEEVTSETAFGPTIFDMEESLCNLVAENNILGTTLKAKRYTCEELGIVRAEAHTFFNAITSDENIKNKVCAKLKIAGYELG